MTDTDGQDDHGRGPDQDQTRESDSHDHGDSEESAGQRHDHGHSEESAGQRHDHGHSEESTDQRHSHDHDHHHHDVESLGAAVLTISSSRSLDDDPAGDVIVAAFESAGHTVVTRDLVRDEYDSIQGTVQRLVERDDTDVVVTTGGTGITPDDVTVEAIKPLLDKKLPGFGELFRQLSRDEIGTRVVGTRATAGISHGVPTFCLPGSENAARLGAEAIIVREAPHLAGLARRDDDA